MEVALSVYGNSIIARGPEQDEYAPIPGLVVISVVISTGRRNTLSEPITWRKRR